jgi:hypothetical protein
MLILFKKNNSEDRYDIVDGQQRRVAIRDFYEKNDFKLLNVSNPKLKFPIYLRSITCDWADRNYHNLTEEAKKSFLNYNVPVCIISEASEEELRDIFIRLQSGTPLSSQETRDAMPGEFSEFIREIGGVRDIDGHDFMETFAKKIKIDRGKIRQLTSQIFLLFLELERNARFCDITTQKLDEVYYEYIGMDEISIYRNRFIEILDDLYSCIDNLKLENHEIIHLFLFAKECKNLGLKNWKDKIEEAFLEFKNNINKFKRDETSPYWLNYLAKTRVDAVKIKNIAERHRFFSEKMLERMYRNLSVDIIEIKDEKYLWEHALLDKYLELEKVDNFLFKDELLAFFVPNEEQIILEKPNADIENLDTVIEKLMIKLPESPELMPVIELLKKQREDLVNELDTKRKRSIANQNAKQEVYRITSIKAIRKDGKVEKGNSLGNLIPRLYPQIYGDGTSRNYVGFILGTDRETNIFEEFWQDYDQLEFLMKNKSYKVKRRDFDTFWPNRFPNIS